MPDEQAEGPNAPQEIREEVPRPSPKKNFLFELLMHFLTLLGGALSAGLWLKFVSLPRFEEEWGKDCFRAPLMLCASTGFFFLMGMGLVYGLKQIITWLRECRTY
jgi:hypothetical protein